MRRVLLAACILFLATGLARGQTPVMKLDDVRPGMKGVMRTVLKGVELEDIPVEVIDVVRKVSPGRDIVIIRLEGEKAQRLGVARGMSGSPVYIDGKLLGAMAFAWRFVREPFAGVTPIESMTEVWRAKDAPAADDAVAWSPGRSLPSDHLLEELLSPRPANSFLCPANMRTLETPIAVNGLSKAAMMDLAGRLRPFDVSVVDGGVAGKAANVPADLKLVPGGVICVQLVRGDLEAAGIGTVTEVVGNRFYAFGHPMFSNGSVRCPVATGYINAVIPSDETSFKVGSVVKTVGTLWVDQSAAIAGEVGPIPDMLKLSLDVKRRDLSGDSHYNFEVIKDPRMMLSFLAAALGDAVQTAGQPDRAVKILVKSSIDVEGYKPVEIDEVFGGPQAPVDAMNSFIGPVGLILHNPYGRVNIRSVSISTEVIPGDPRALIRLVETDKTEYHPGDEIDVAVTFQPYRVKSFIRHFKLKIPIDVPEGPLSLMVCDPATDQRMEMREMPHRYRPEDVAGTIDFFRRSHPNTDVVFRLSRESAGLAAKGRELPELPDSVISVLGKQPSTEVTGFSTPIVRREPTEFVVVGTQQMQINVTKP